MRLRSGKGFSLVEMVMVMAVFSIVIGIVGSSFNTLLKYSTRFAKSEESNIEGNIGLELLRHDIATAGYGLPSSFSDTAVNYAEAVGAPASALNDAPNRAPRAVSGSSNVGTGVTSVGNDNTTYTLLDGGEYLALKGTSLGVEAAGNQPPVRQMWSYALFNNETTSQPPKRWPTGNLGAGDQVVVLTRSAASADGSYQLLNAGSQFSTSYPASGGMHYPFTPRTPLDTAYLYGLAPAGSSPVRMPFNRADYFVAKPPAGSGQLPSYCEPNNTGILYRGIVRNSTDATTGGKLDFQPVLDCVASMHVVLGWNTTGTGTVDTWTNVDGTRIYGSAVDMTSAATVTKQLKVVKLYILAQDGRKDTSYTSPALFKLYNPAEEGTTTVGATYTLKPEMLNYRWKLYKLVVRPKNLNSNQ